MVTQLEMTTLVFTETQVSTPLLYVVICLHISCANLNLDGIHHDVNNN
jgi:hypothetical protein